MEDVPPPRPAWLLAASATSASVLVERDAAGALRLPRLADIRVLEERQPVAEAVEAYLGRRQPVLRVLPVGIAADDRATGLLVVVEPLEAAGGEATWVPVDDPRLGSLGLETPAAAAVARWLDEVRSGDVDRRRQRWERPGAEERAIAWMTDRLAAAGTPVLSRPWIQTAWAISALVRADTTGGRAWMKACAWVFADEPAITAALDEAVPGAVPGVVAIDRDEGWLLMRDAGGSPVGDGPVETWAAGLTALGAIQRRLGPVLDGVGLEDRGPATLAVALPELAAGPWAAGFPHDLRASFVAALPRLVDACLRLAELPPAPALVHGDFHPWNVVKTGTAVVAIDWSDTAVGHPFLDLPTYLGRTPDPAARRAMLDTYLDGWTDGAPRDVLEEAALAALVVGSLHQVESYRRIAESLEPGAGWGLEGGVASWTRRALAWLEHGLEATDA